MNTKAFQADIARDLTVLAEAKRLAQEDRDRYEHYARAALVYGQAEEALQDLRERQKMVPPREEMIRDMERLSAEKQVKEGTLAELDAKIAVRSKELEQLNVALIQAAAGHGR